jgi:hypothetical protein
VVGLNPAGGAEPWASTLKAATAEWGRARRTLARALPAADLDALGAGFAAGLSTRLRTPTRWDEPASTATVAQRIRQGVRAVELLALADVTDPDLVLAALQLPWCDPVLGGDRSLATERPRVTQWSEAVLFATLTAEPRPGQDPLAALRAYLRHVATAPPEIRAVAVASWRAGPGARAQHHRELDVTPLLDGLPDGFRDAVLRPPTLLARLTGAPPAPSAPEDPEPITHPDVAVAAARNAHPLAAAGSLTVEEHDVGFLLWEAPDPAQVAAPGSRVPALIVDRQTHAVTSWNELSPAHDIEVYAARHRLFPLLPGWQASERPPIEQGLAADLTHRFPPDVSAPLAAASAQIAEQYRNELSRGTGWPATVDRWNVGTAAVEILLAADLGTPDVLAAALLSPHVSGQDERTARWYLEALPPASARLLDAARTPATAPGQSAGEVFAAHVTALTGAPRKVRAVAAAFAQASARYALARFGGVCQVSRAGLGRLQVLTTDLPAFDAELAAWTKEGSAT